MHQPIGHSECGITLHIDPRLTPLGLSGLDATLKCPQPVEPEHHHWAQKIQGVLKTLAHQLAHMPSAQRLAHRPPPMPSPRSNAYIIEANDESYPKHVIQGSYHRPVLAVFWAPWSVESQAMASYWSLLQQHYRHHLQVVTLNTDILDQTLREAAIPYTPTIRLIHQGRLIKEWVGAQPLQELEWDIQDRLALSRCNLPCHQEHRLKHGTGSPVSQTNEAFSFPGGGWEERAFIH